MINGLLFDFAGVIGSDGHWVWLKEVLSDVEKKRASIQEIDNEVDRGSISNEVYAREMARVTGTPPERVRSETIQRVLINWELISFMKSLKKKYKIGLLSNFTHQWLEEILNVNHLLPVFDAVYISSLYGMIKPEAGAFEKAIELLGLTKAEVLFIDDRQVYVDAAITLGIQSLLFTTNAQFKDDLMALGVHI